MSGFTKLPELLLTLAVKYPFFGDLVKAQLLAYEFRHDRTDKPASFCFAPAIGLMDAAVEKAEESAEAKEVWFSGMVGDADLESLQEMVKSKSEILFPGVLYGWDSKENALSYLATLSGENAQNDVHRVIYKAKTKAVPIAGVNLVVHRYSAKVGKHSLDGNINFIDLEEISKPLKANVSSNFSTWKQKSGLGGKKSDKGSQEAEKDK